MAPDTLNDLYLAELQEARSFERQIATTVGRLAGKASDPELKETLEGDRPESEGHAERIAAMLERRGIDPDAHTDQTMEAILKEACTWADEIGDPAVRDAAIIASLQRVQHYEIAAYGALVAWAKTEGLDAEARTLDAILDEEKAADARLTEIAEKTVNARAI